MGIWCGFAPADFCLHHQWKGQWLAKLKRIKRCPRIEGSSVQRDSRKHLPHSLLNRGVFATAFDTAGLDGVVFDLKKSCLKSGTRLTSKRSLTLKIDCKAVFSTPSTIRRGSWLLPLKKLFSACNRETRSAKYG